MTGDPSERGAERRRRLEAEHRPQEVRRRLSERRRQSYLGDAILGGIDGCVTTFAVVAGTVGGGFSSVSPSGATQTKGDTSYVLRRRKQADRAEHLRSAQHPRP